LLTGDTGFVGSAILSELIKTKEYYIVGVSRTILNFERPLYKHVSIDYSQPEFRRELTSYRAKLLIHCAWSSLPSRSAVETRRNVENSIELFKNFRETGGERIIAFGTCLEKLGSYDEVSPDKNALEDLCFGRLKTELLNELSKLNMPYNWIRPFYLFGNNQHKNSLLNRTLANLYLGVDWIRSPTQQNDFIYLKDLAKFVKEIIEAQIVFPEIMDFGTGIATCNIAFVNVVRNTLGFSSYELPKDKPSTPLIAQNADWRRLLPYFSLSSISEAVEDILLNDK
jgi:nucleoside-diphosphate-sugar epimerase